MTTRQLLPQHWAYSTTQQGFSRKQIVRYTLLAAFLVYVFTSAGAGALFGGMAAAAGAVLLLWRFPMLGASALIVLGAIHPTLMLLVYHLGKSTALLRVAQVWKEGVLLVLLLKVIHEAFLRRRVPKLYLLDLAIVLFLAYGGFYLLYPSALDDSTLFTKAMGLRADALFLVAYFVGRGLTIRIRQVRTLLILFGGISVVIALVAGAQFLAPGATNALFERLSFGEYMEIQRGDAAVQFVVRDRAVAGALIPRASSLLLSDLALSFYALLALPLATAAFLTLRGLRQKVITNVWVLAMLAIAVLSGTRSAMIALVPALAVLVWRARRLLLPGLLALQVGIGLMLAAYYMEVDAALLRELFSPAEGSVQGHVGAIEQSLDALMQDPLGRGLGTAGQVSQRFSPVGGITNESWYLQIATEMGVIGGMIFGLLVVGFALVAMRQYGRVSHPWLKTLCLAMFAATVAFGLVGITLHVWEGLTTSMMFWLLAGVVVRAHDLEAADQEIQDAHRGLA